MLFRIEVVRWQRRNENAQILHLHLNPSNSADCNDIIRWQQHIYYDGDGDVVDCYCNLVTSL